jgi:hypothetical protein
MLDWDKQELHITSVQIREGLYKLRVTRRLTRTAGRQRGSSKRANGWLTQNLACGAVVRKGSTVAVGTEIGAEERNVERDYLTGSKPLGGSCLDAGSSEQKGG